MIIGESAEKYFFPLIWWDPEVVTFAKFKTWGRVVENHMLLLNLPLNYGSIYWKRFSTVAIFTELMEAWCIVVGKSHKAGKNYNVLNNIRRGFFRQHCIQSEREVRLVAKCIIWRIIWFPEVVMEEFANKSLFPSTFLSSIQWKHEVVLFQNVTPPISVNKNRKNFLTQVISPSVFPLRFG